MISRVGIPSSKAAIVVMSLSLFPASFALAAEPVFESDPRNLLAIIRETQVVDRGSSATTRDVRDAVWMKLNKALEALTTDLRTDDALWKTLAANLKTIGEIDLMADRSQLHSHEALVVYAGFVLRRMPRGDEDRFLALVKTLLADPSIRPWFKRQLFQAAMFGHRSFLLPTHPDELPRYDRKLIAFGDSLLTPEFRLDGLGRLAMRDYVRSLVGFSLPDPRDPMTSSNPNHTSRVLFTFPPIDKNRGVELAWQVARAEDNRHLVDRLYFFTVVMENDPKNRAAAIQTLKDAVDEKEVDDFTKLKCIEVLEANGEQFPPQQVEKLRRRVEDLSGRKGGMYSIRINGGTVRGNPPGKSGP